MSNLIKYDQARRALAECRDVDEVKDIRDKSDAMRLYAKQANDSELEQWAAEIKLRAQRAIGEISAGLQKKASRHTTLPVGGKCRTETLADAGISTSTAHRYEQLAAIPLPAVEAYIAHSKQAGKPVSAKAVLAASKPKSEPGNGTIKDAKGGTAKSASGVGQTAIAEDSAHQTILGHYDLTSDVTSIDQLLAHERAENEILRGQVRALQAQTETPAGGTAPVEANEASLAVVDELGQLRGQVADLAARLEAVLAENQMMSNVFAADDKVQASMAEAKKHKAKANEDNRALYVSKLQVVELTRQVQFWKDRAEKAQPTNIAV